MCRGHPPSTRISRRCRGAKVGPLAQYQLTSRRFCFAAWIIMRESYQRRDFLCIHRINIHKTAFVLTKHLKWLFRTDNWGNCIINYTRVNLAPRKRRRRRRRRNRGAVEVISAGDKSCPFISLSGALPCDTLCASEHWKNAWMILFREGFACFKYITLYIFKGSEISRNFEFKTYHK